ncbi:aminotransferase class I/II-fold pyridoxal phosphate-dependent enzyme [Aegicerativicinus sediminis]|uniref:aminotransferase class I/II-fold pyridoxal phosphate-dependent enzyme n=1 Tax=Aegicerativicinus sediminis TaxID=2893202 RepID=UPI001E5AADE5|nr:aminotransferase class I/II-fold pyridoxal phosphate-dependent enzyme [Aegicerativicinus sediminis]
MKIEAFPGRTISFENKSYLYFGGTSYLGISTNKKFQERFAHNLGRWGTFYGSSRKANIQLSVYQDFENFMAKKIGSENALVTSAGVMAAKMVLGFLSRRDLKFFHYPGSHPAIIAPNSTSLFIENKLNSVLTDNIKETIVICLDAVLGSHVKKTDLSFLEMISKAKSVILVVDESHSIGILGKSGNGIFSTIDHPIIKEKIMVSSLGKALGIGAGLIAGSGKLVSEIGLTPDFVTSSGPAPAILQTFLDSQELYENQRELLESHLSYIDAAFVNTGGFSFNKRYPVIYSKNPNIYQHCLSNGLVITQFGYPDKANLISRIVITADHRREDIETLVTVLNNFE